MRFFHSASEWTERPLPEWWESASKVVTLPAVQGGPTQPQPDPAPKRPQSMAHWPLSWRHRWAALDAPEPTR